MKTIQVVAAIIVKDNKILCTQRGNKGVIALKWEFPGGKIEENETNESALIREIQEELSCNINVDSYFMKVNHEYPTFYLKMHSYICKLKSENEQVILNEHINHKWLDIEELNTLDWAEGDIPIVNKLMGEEL